MKHRLLCSRLCEVRPSGLENKAMATISRSLSFRTIESSPGTRVLLDALKGTIIDSITYDVYHESHFVRGLLLLHFLKTGDLPFSRSAGAVPARWTTVRIQ